MKTLLVPLLALVATAAVGPFDTATLRAQPVETFEDWMLTCDETHCEISQSLQTTTAGKRFLTFAIRQERSDEAPQLLIRLPLGIALHPGVKVLVADNSWHFFPTACYPDGCLVSEQAAMEIIDLFQSSAAAEVRFFSAASEAQVSATVSLKGFRLAYEAMRAQSKG